MKAMRLLFILLLVAPIALDAKKANGGPKGGGKGGGGRLATFFGWGSGGDSSGGSTGSGPAPTTSSAPASTSSSSASSGTAKSGGNATAPGNSSASTTAGSKQSSSGNNAQANLASTSNSNNNSQSSAAPANNSNSGNAALASGVPAFNAGPVQNSTLTVTITTGTTNTNAPSQSSSSTPAPAQNSAPAKSSDSGRSNTVSSNNALSNKTVNNNSAARKELLSVSLGEGSSGNTASSNKLSGSTKSSDNASRLRQLNEQKDAANKSTSRLAATDSTAPQYAVLSAGGGSSSGGSSQNATKLRTARGSGHDYKQPEGPYFGPTSNNLSNAERAQQILKQPVNIPHIAESGDYTGITVFGHDISQFRGPLKESFLRGVPLNKDAWVGVMKDVPFNHSFTSFGLYAEPSFRAFMESRPEFYPTLMKFMDAINGAPVAQKKLENIKLGDGSNLLNYFKNEYAQAPKKIEEQQKRLEQEKEYKKKQGTMKEDENPPTPEIQNPGELPEKPSVKEEQQKNTGVAATYQSYQYHNTPTVFSSPDEPAAIRKESEISAEAHQILKTTGIASSNFIGQDSVIATRAVELVNQAGKLYAQSADNKQIQNAALLATHCAHEGAKCAKAMNTPDAVLWHDAGFACIEFAQFYDQLQAMSTPTDSFKPTLRTYMLSAVEGINKGIENILHLCMHPVESLTNMGQLAALVVKTLAADGNETVILPPTLQGQANNYLMAEVDKLDVSWNAITSSLGAMSGPEITQEVAQFVTEGMLYNRLFGVLGKLGKVAQVQGSQRLKAFTNYVTKENLDAAHNRVLMHIQEFDAIHARKWQEFFGKPQVAGVPAKVEFSLMEQGGEQVAGGGAKVVSQKINVANALTNIPQTCAQLDASVGNIPKLEKALLAFKDLPGAQGKDGPITKLIQNGRVGAGPGNLSTARGAAYELEVAYDLMQRGEEIIAFCNKIGSREFDIITKTRVIECKNTNWNNVDLQKFQMISGEQYKIAKSVNKTFEIHSHFPIPENIRNWLIKKEIRFFEGL